LLQPAKAANASGARSRGVGVSIVAGRYPAAVSPTGER